MQRTGKNLRIKSKKGNCDMDMQDLVSIIVPIYKVEQYLERCIESIVNQTYKNIEIILVDDGSPDQCPKICDEWAKKDSRIKVVHKQNGGLSDARNAGLEIATGKYVVFIDSDDYIHLQFVEALYKTAQEQNADIVSCEYEKVVDEKTENWTKEYLIQDIKAKQVSTDCWEETKIYAWNKLYAKELFDKIRFPYGKIHEDVGVWWELMDKAKKICKVEHVLYFYYENPAGITNKPYTIVHMDLVDVLFGQYKKFKSEKKEKLADRVLIECLNSYPGIYNKLKKSGCFTKKEKRVFFESYREKIRIAKQEGISKKILWKHRVYYFWPCIMKQIYSRKNG